MTPTPTPALTILYVDDPAASARFWEQVLGTLPVEQSPTFAMFKPGPGPGLGLWSRHTVEPASSPPGGTEIALIASDPDAVHADWSARGWPILQPPITLDFGRTFVALDPDGHRIRVFLPSD